MLCVVYVYTSHGPHRMTVSISRPSKAFNIFSIIVWQCNYENKHCSFFTASCKFNEVPFCTKSSKMYMWSELATAPEKVVIDVSKDWPLLICHSILHLLKRWSLCFLFEIWSNFVKLFSFPFNPFISYHYEQKKKPMMRILLRYVIATPLTEEQCLYRHVMLWQWQDLSLSLVWPNANLQLSSVRECFFYENRFSYRLFSGILDWMLFFTGQKVYDAWSTCLWWGISRLFKIIGSLYPKSSFSDLRLQR